MTDNIDKIFVKIQKKFLRLCEIAGISEGYYYTEPLLYNTLLSKFGEQAIIDTAYTVKKKDKYYKMQTFVESIERRLR